MTRRFPDASPHEAFRLARSTSHLLHRAQQLASERFADLAGAKGLTHRQFAVLAAISENPGLSQTELGLATGIDRSTLADMMARLEKRGLVSRKLAAHDGRMNTLTLHPAGEDIYRGAVHFAKAADAAILDILPKGKRRSFLATLETLARSADKRASLQRLGGALGAGGAFARAGERALPRRGKIKG